MSVVNLRYPDGKVESKKLLSAINKNGTEIVVVDLEFIDNGHKVTGVLYNSDGFYHNILDQDKWKEITGYLIDSIHGLLTDNEYQVVTEINVSADPYRQLSLRDENYASLVNNYEGFLSRVQTPVEEVKTVDDISVASEPLQVDELVSATPSVETPEPVEQSTIVTDNIPETSKFTNLESEAVNMNSVIPENNPAMEPQAIDNGSVVPEIPAAPAQEEMSLSDLIASAPVTEPQPVTPALNPFEETSMVDNDQNAVIEQSVAENKEEPVLNETVSVADSIQMPTTPVTEIPVEEKAPEMSSVVTDSYMKSFENIKMAMNDLANEATQKIESIKNEFNAKIDELANQAKGSLQEAKTYGELARDTFDKAQNNVINFGLNQNDSLNESPELNLTKAA